MWRLLLTLSLATAAGAATINVPADYATVQGAVNVAVAGDTVLVAAGDYPETVTTKAHGADGNRIVIRAQYERATDPAQMSIIRAFRVQHRYITLQGMHVVRGGADLNQGLVRVECNGTTTDGSNLILTNNCIRDSLLAVSTNAAFGSNYMTTTDVVFTNFANGDKVFLGADSHNWHTNHDTALTVSGTPTNGMIFFTTSLEEDTGTNYWAPLYAGSDNSGYRGIILDNTGSTATNVTITHCIISNIFGSAFHLTGSGHTIEDNIIAGMKGRYAFRFSSANTTVRRNLIYEGKNIIWFTPWEMANIEHPPGGDWYDYQANIMDCQPAVGDAVTNVLLELNWFQNCENQAGLFTGNATSSGLTLRSNVFVGMQAQGGGSMDDLVYQNNTFYLCAYDIDRSAVLALGGLTVDNHQTGLVVSNNVFVNVGSHYTRTAEGSYTVSEYTDSPVLTNNFCAGPETTGWESKSEAPDGITFNGGDPLFVDALNPLGPDGLPFTDDDGLRPLPNSVIAANGLGALAALGSSAPLAHFSVSGVTNWFDALGTNYNADWVEAPPGLRDGPIRPWTEPESLGHIPLMVTFDASKSIDAKGTNNHVIRFYGWTFGDEGAVVTVLPIVSHTYMRTGEVSVVLWVTNYYGDYDSFTNTYKLLAQTNSANLYYVATNGLDANPGTLEEPWLTLNKAADVVAAGDYVAASQGDYPENVDITTAGTPASPIHWIGYGANAGCWNIRKSHQVIEGFCNSGSNANNGFFYYYCPVTNVVAINNYIGPTTNTVLQGLYFVPAVDGADPDAAQIGCSVSNNIFRGIPYGQMTLYGRGHRVQGNIMRDTDTGQCDLFRIWGADTVACDNFATDLCKVSENHTDFYQIFGPTEGTDYMLATNIVLERNTIQACKISVCQIENKLNPVGYFTNIIIRNNVFNAFTGQANIDGDGVKFYNNLFYRNAAGGTAVFGGEKGSAYGSEFINNIFFECGNGSATVGWYQWMESQSISNYSLIADYNFVCGTNSTAKDTAPPSGIGKWGSTGGVPPNTWEEHGINGGDPLFISAANGDFRLATNSPLVGSGLAIAGVETDFYSETRPDPPSIGPFEADTEPEDTPASITFQPQSVARQVGQNATFTVTATGTAPLTYQWKLGGDDITDATTSSYATNSVPLAANGNSYTVGVSNALGGELSDAAVLTVTNAPAAPGGAKWNGVILRGAIFR